MIRIIFPFLLFSTFFQVQLAFSGDYNGEMVDNVSVYTEKFLRLIFENLNVAKNTELSDEDKVKNNQSINQEIFSLLNGLDREARESVVNVEFLEISEDEKKSDTIRTPIQYALLAKNMELVSRLADEGADMFCIPKNGNSLFHLALIDLDILKKLIEIVKEKKVVDQIRDRHAKVIMYAIYEKKFDHLKFLMSEGNPFHKFVNSTELGLSPLHIAVGEGHSEAVRILLEAGANVFLKAGKDEVQPIHVAAAHGDVNSYSLIEKQIEVEMEKKGEANKEKFFAPLTKESFMTPAHFAAFRGNAKILRLLLNKTCVNLNWQNMSGMTPLHFAVSKSHTKCVKAILVHQPDLFVKDSMYNDVIDYAGHKNTYGCGALLVNYINSFHDEIKNTYRNLNLLEVKMWWLVSSIIDREEQDEEVTKIVVHTNPTFNEFIEDLKKIREELFRTAKLVKDLNGEKKWHKFKLPYLEFKSEEGDSYGPAIFRDYLNKGAKLIFDNEKDIFLSADGGTSYGFAHRDGEISKDSEIIELIGVFTALAILYHPAHLPFAPYVYKSVAGEKLSVEDFIDESVYNRLIEFEKLTSEELEEMQIPVEWRIQLSRGENGIKDVVLVESAEFLTKENFPIYKRNLTRLLMSGGNRFELIKAFKKGFYTLIPKFFLKTNLKELNSNLFSSKELVDIIAELPIDADEWKKYTEYESDGVEGSLQVQWFWNFVRRSDNDTRKKLLQFCTGSARLYIGGFKSMKLSGTPFSIELARDKEMVFPQVRACFYELVLPQVEDEETFYKNISFAIENCEEFSFI
ncbi:MAG: ankyrin repeat domain-containing protein [Myxococcales bacterium]|nr:ankyrin repeat domain-containing protein [Myxococcales bacterium]USN51154.1 MAG: ankyrin repeat domain-containing protein [Myxococcales bacterium]